MEIPVTTQLRTICENLYDPENSEYHGFNMIDNILDNVHSKIFSFDYPIFDENYKKHLEKKILRSYYMRRIGLETIGLWQMRLEVKMNEIMPYYNKLYLSEKLKFDPFINTDFDVKTDVDKYGNNSSTTGSSKNNDSITDTWQTLDSNTDLVHGENIDHEFNEQNDLIYGSSETLEHGLNTDTIHGLNVHTDMEHKRTDDLVEVSDAWNANSDTPQSLLENVDNKKYVSDYTKKHDQIKNTGTQTNRDLGDVENTGTDTVKNTGNDVNIHDGKDTNNHTGNNTDTHSGTDTTNRDDITHTNVNSDSTENFDEDKNGEYNDNENSLSNTYGKTGGDTYSKMLNEYRTTFLNIDQMVINELAPLFLGIVIP